MVASGVTHRTGAWAYASPGVAKENSAAPAWHSLAQVMTFASLIGLISYASDVSGGLAQMAQDLLETLRAASQLAPNAVSEI